MGSGASSSPNPTRAGGGTGAGAGADPRRSNWVDPSIKTGPTGMPRDPPLAAYGHQQALRLSEFISSPSALAPYPLPERVFSSPFYRCVQTAVPSAQKLGNRGLMLEHGVSEWYSPVNPSTGLHPRPGDPSDLSRHFPGEIDISYTSTVFPSRSGESLLGLQDRADLFVEAWTSRVEAMGLRCVVIFAHAASVIALGRAFTGDKYLEVSAGCTSTSLFRRKRPSTTSAGGPTVNGLHPSRSTGTLAAASGLLALSSPDTPSSGSPISSKSQAAGGAKFQVEVGESLDGPVLAPAPQVDGDPASEFCGVGEWEVVYLGKADYLDNGVERDWSFRDAVIVNGQVINDDGDHRPHPPADTIPTGLAPGMERYLRRGAPLPNKEVLESRPPPQSKI